MPNGRNLEPAAINASTKQSDFPPWIAPTISAASAVVAGIALFIAIRSNRRSDRVERVNLFDREYGSELRTLLRKIDAKIALLDGFTVTSAVPLAKQKNELATAFPDLDELSSQIVLILEEIDEDESLTSRNLAARFRSRCDAAEEQISGAVNIASSQTLLFQRAVTKAQSEYKAGVRVLRRELRHAGRKKNF